MLNRLVTRIFGSRNDRQINRMIKEVEKINVLEPDYQALSDEALKGKTEEFKQRLEAGESLKQLLPEAFAAVREASQRTLGMRHYDVQLVGGMVLHSGNIAEMRTGEGKTLVATLPVYLNALTGNGVHVVTVNDYLARRDANWMRPVYEALGLTVGVSVPGMTPPAKRAAYACDVTYGTNNEFGFDYLRDNMAFTAEDRVQRGQFFAIVDEVDSILIDEARTPLIISGPTEDSPKLYVQIDKLVPRLKPVAEPDGPGDFSVDEKAKQVYLTEEGMANVEDMFVRAGLLAENDSLYTASNLSLVHHLNAALRAHMLFQKDVDYIVRDGEVVIVDEFTGRTLVGRRWSEGLHQAVEAKEGVPIQRENQTLASITFQNYFRLYDKLSGMTGTADTEAYEFQSIYGLEVLVVPTHRDMIRDDRGDLVYLTQKEKWTAIVEDIRDCNHRGQPVLVGTTSIETSELISKRLKKEGVRHEVLNAKQHEREAQIVAQAGRPGAVTIATNMAGRGTDIVLGGNLESELEELGEGASENQTDAIREEWKQRHAQVLEAGGLHIIGTERHESRRIDNQLRGRSGRQGDPGSSRFYLSLEDSLMRIFASDRVAGMMRKLGMEEGEAIEHGLVSKAIENAQRKVEGHNFDIRKNLLDFDDVANDQRKVIYEQRNDLLDSDDVAEVITGIREDVVADLTLSFVPPGSVDEQWDIAGLEQALEGDFGVKIDLQHWLEGQEEATDESVMDRVQEAVSNTLREKEETTGPEVMRHFEKAVMLKVLDMLWKDHLANMDHLRQGIHLRGYAQKQPKQEYRRESFSMFQDLLERIKHEVVQILTRVRLKEESDVEAVDESRRSETSAADMQFRHAQATSALSSAMAGAPGGPGGPGASPQGGAAPGSGRAAQQPATPFVREAPKVGRNDPCPCGSGKKYKQCHGKIA